MDYLQDNQFLATDVGEFTKNLEEGYRLFLSQIYCVINSILIRVYMYNNESNHRYPITISTSTADSATRSLHDE